MDYFTKWPEAFALPNQEAGVVAKAFVEEFACRYGIPPELHTDQGRNFESQLLKEVCRLLEIRKTRTPPLRPQSDGMVERFNRTLVQQLTFFTATNQEGWDEHLPYLLMAYRASQHGSTACSPALLMYGRELRSPVDLLCGSTPERLDRPPGRAMPVSWRKAWRRSTPSHDTSSNRRA